MIQSIVALRLARTRAVRVGAVLCLAAPLISFASGCDTSNPAPSPTASAGNSASNAGTSGSSAGASAGASANTAGASGSVANGGTTNSGGANHNGGQAGDSAAQGGDTTAGQGGDAAAGEGGAPGLQMQGVIDHYREWQARSDQPVDISAEIFGLCRLPTDAENAFIDSAHKGYALRDWVNPIASDALAQTAHPVFPVGAAIVKEKFARQTSDGQLVLAALGVMLKREIGFDPAHADWEFGYWTEAKGLSSGGPEFATCMQCHAKASTDYAYLDDSWRK